MNATKKGVFLSVLTLLLLVPAPMTGSPQPLPAAAPPVPGMGEAPGIEAFIPPPPPEMLPTFSGSWGPEPQYWETSEYFIGRVAVAIVLPESDSSTDASTEDWTGDERALVLSEIEAACEWWAAREPNAHLEFVYEMSVVDTTIEPISRPHGDQSIWITEALTQLGFSEASYFNGTRQFNDALRKKYDTDWAFTFFVVDSSSDSDNRFADRYFAYAYVGGPFAVMTYGNNGYGPYNMDAVAAHEIGHIFGCQDQYYRQRVPCTRASGYLGVETQNSEYGPDGLYGGCAINVSSIMRGQVWPYASGSVDPYARGQLGWQDSDGDGILDPVDTTAVITNVVAITGTAGVLVSGRALDVPCPAASLHRGCTINTIKQVQWRVPGGEWHEAQPKDGAFDSAEEEFQFLAGSTDFEIRALNTAPQPMPPPVLIFLPLVARGR